MKGTMTERPEGSGTWRLRVYVGRDGRGRPVQRSKTIHGGKRDAEDQLRTFVTKVMSERVVERAATVGEMMRQWMELREGDVTPYTMSADRYRLERRIIPDLGTVKLDRLDAHLLDRTYRRWTKEGLSDGSVRKHHNMLSGGLSMAVKYGWLATNPAKSASPPVPDGSVDRSISPAELRRMLTSARAGYTVQAEDGTERAREPVLWLAMAIAFAAVTGCRRGELCAIRWSDVDHTSRTLTVGRSVTVVDGEMTVGGTKTHQVRRMLLDVATMKMVADYQDRQRESATADGVKLDRDPYLLSLSPSSDRPILPNTLTHRFAALMADLGMPYHLHELRHFSATTMIAAGVNVRQVATRLGHSTPTLTLNTYAHAVEAADQAAADVLGLAIGP